MSIVTSPDGQSKVHQIISASDSSKFYVPTLPASANDTPIQQDLGRVGYYIYTVNGSRVIVDYYADAAGGNSYRLGGGPFDFRQVSSVSYSLNGKDNLVAEGHSYAMSDDTTLAAKMGSGFMGTAMPILSGSNGSSKKTNLLTHPSRGLKILNIELTISSYKLYAFFTTFLYDTGCGAFGVD